MKFFTLLLLTSAVLVLTGCPKNAPNLDLSSSAVKQSAVVQMKENVFPAEVFQYECWRTGTKKIVFTTDSQKQQGKPSISVNNGAYTYSYICTDLEPGDSINGENKAREVRNQVFQKGQGIIDEVYFKYSTAVRTNRSRSDFILDLVDVGLGTAIGLTKGKASTIRDLGIVLIGYRSGRDSSRLRLYDDQTTEIILDTMDAARAEVLLNFRNNSSTEPVSSYSLEAVFADLYKYYAVGSQTEAFKRIRRKAAASAEQTENAVLNIKEPISPYVPKEEATKATLEYGEIVKAFRSEILKTDQESDASKKEARLKELNSALKEIFDNVTAGDLNEKFKLYLNALYKRPTESFSWSDIGKEFAENSATLTSAKVANRLNLLVQLRIELYQNAELGKAEDLITRMNELFNKHQPR